MVPVKMQMRKDQKLSDVREQLSSAGCKVGESAIYAKGSAAVVDDDTSIRDLPDMRLIVSPEAKLPAWRLSLAHRTLQQRLTDQTTHRHRAMSVQAMTARNP